MVRVLVAMVLAAVAALGPTAARAQDAGAVAVPPASAATPPESTFELGLANLSGPWPDRFLLFGDHWSAEVAVALRGVPSAWGGAQTGAPQRLVGLRGFGLGVRFGEGTGPDGRPRLVLAPLYRDWDDLDGWEKLGLALQYAGAAAAIGHFVGKLAH